MDQSNQKIFELGTVKIDVTNFNVLDFLAPLEYDVKIKNLEDYYNMFEEIHQMILNYEFLELYGGDELAKILKFLSWMKNMFEKNCQPVSEVREIKL